MLLNNSQLINQDSGNTEYYTPLGIIENARHTMGGIDLDPASSAKANTFVRATTFFTAQDDSLNRRWFGNVWMNHPFSAGESPCKTPCNKKRCPKRGHCIFHAVPSNADWINKLVSSYRGGDIVMGVCITYASTSEKWFQPLFNFPQCYLAPRTNYYLPGGELKKGVTKGSVVTFVGPDHKYDKFIEVFRGMGAIMLPDRGIECYA